MSKWLDNAIFYEIYPQSFVDSNGDGIGDIPGITLKLDYIKDLGCNAIWLNPCFDSPFKDAGYDVRDYKKVASRYGTNDDLIALFDAAHRRDMHVILDLVPGHTSEEHEWFHRSCKVERNNYSDRYIWTDSWISGGDGLPFIGGESPRNGTYILNFFKCQPALNYGFAHPERSWQKPALGPDAKATCDAMVDVMRFWLSRGADGFRVDMADSLVKKDDEGKPYTIRTWQYMFARSRVRFGMGTARGVDGRRLRHGFLSRLALGRRSQRLQHAVAQRGRPVEPQGRQELFQRRFRHADQRIPGRVRAASARSGNGRRKF